MTIDSTSWAGQKAIIAFTHIAPDGKTAGLYNGRELRCHGALPGEEALVRIEKHNRGRLVAELLARNTDSLHRVEPKEEHHRYCSPWQAMDYAYQCEIKKAWLQNHFPAMPAISFASASIIYEYRTKIEFGFVEHNNELNFSVRGHGSKIPAPEGCVLASANMNQQALRILYALRKQNTPARTLKSLVIRESKSHGRIIAALYTKTKDAPSLLLKDFPELAGLTVAYSDPERIVSTATEILHQEGQSYLEEIIINTSIRYPFDSFFQNNIPLFKQAILDMQKHMLSARHVVELYAGVGTIGLTLAPYAKRITAYEIAPSMVDYANKNAQLNAAAHYASHALPAENIPLEALNSADTLVVNPTRRGLKESLTKKLLAAHPKQIIYLSCNLGTLNRDAALLQSDYNISFIKGYDFYPNTPHQETLLVLTRR